MALPAPAHASEVFSIIIPGDGNGVLTVARTAERLVERSVISRNPLRPTGAGLERQR
jgi:hypothetical protein